MKVTICDLCGAVITGHPQGDKPGGPAVSRTVTFKYGPPEAVMNTGTLNPTLPEVSGTNYEVCDSCFGKVREATEALRQTRIGTA